MKRSYRKRRRLRKRAYKNSFKLTRPAVGLFYSKQVLPYFSYGYAVNVGGEFKGDFTVAWQQPSGIIAQVVGFDKGGRFSGMYKQFEQYAITGLKIEFMPYNVAAGSINDGSVNSSGGRISMLRYHYDQDSYTTHLQSDTTVLNNPTTKYLDFRRPFKIYYDFKHLSKQMDYVWQNCYEYSPISYNGLSYGSTNFHFEGGGFSNPTAIGTWNVKWYVTFRGQGFSN